MTPPPRDSAALLVTTADALSRSKSAVTVRSTRGYALVAIAATLWGTWSLFFRRAGVDPRWTTPIVFSAMIIGGAPLLMRRAARSAGPHTRQDWTRMGLLGLGDAANAWLFFQAMDRTTVALAVLSHYLAPMLVALLAPAWLGTPKQRGAVLRAMIATAGLLLVLQPWRLSGLAPRHLVGAAFGAASAFFYAANVFLSKQVSTRFSAEETLVFHSIVSLAVLLPFAPWSAIPSITGVGIVASAGLLVGVSAAVCFVRGVAVIPPEHASVLTFLEPITAVAIGVIAFSEGLNVLAMIGAAIVIATGVRSARA